jgi:serpin B
MPEEAARAAAGAAADDAFGARLLQLLAEQATDIVFSPASVAGALRMALCGARGQTAAELAAALQLGGAELGGAELGGAELGGVPEAAAEGLRGMAALVADVTAAGLVTLRAPAEVWVQAGLALAPGFTARLGPDAVAAADFAAAPQAARERINQAVAGQTAGRITGLLAPSAVSAATRLVLTSAVYLKAGWAQGFAESQTTDAPFYPGGPALTVRMMHGTAARPYLRGQGYQAVLLPYQDSRLGLAVVRPDGPLASLLPLLAAGGLRGLLAGAARHEVTLAMPKFRLQTALDLIPALRRLGVREAFSGDADFTGMTSAARLAIDAVAHKAFIDVDEHGTEAAAATAISFRPLAAFRGPPRVSMTVDRPFLFAIVHLPSGLPLFLGQVSHPPSPA